MTIEDTRIGGETRHVFTENKHLMFIPDEMRKCVVFVGYRKADGSTHLAGSGFFVGRIMADDLPELNIGYVVTAAHILNSIRNMGLSKVLLRVNTNDDELQWIDTDLSAWRFHSDPAADTAVLRKSVSDDMSHRQWPIRAFATSEIIRNERIGIGEDVFCMGLFSEHYGKAKNIPIVRVGNIAAMPEEPIATKLGPIQAYLMEARSIGGLSGSPVFVNTGGGARSIFVDTVAKFYLLGLVHGHFDVNETEYDTVADDGIQRAPINTGIAIVIPAERIMEVIRSFFDEEQSMIAAIRSRKFPTMDSSS